MKTQESDELTWPKLHDLGNAPVWRYEREERSVQKKGAFQQMVLEQLGTHWQTHTVASLFHVIYKN